MDPFILKTLIEEIQAAEVTPVSGAEGFESAGEAREIRPFRLRTQSQISLLHSNWHGKIS